MGKLNKKQIALIAEMHDAIKDYVLSQGGMILTDVHSEDGEVGDTINTYIYNECNVLMEYEVKGIKVENDKVYVCFDDEYTYYEKEDLEMIEDVAWYSLLHSDILGWFTAMNIVEALNL